MPVIAPVCEFVGEAPARVVLLPFEIIGQAAADTAAWLFEMVWTAIDSTTLVDVTTDGFVSVYNIMFGIGVLVALVFFFLQLATGAIRRDPGGLKYALLGLARAILGGFLVITLTATLLEVVDQLTIGVVQATGQTMETLGEKIGLLVFGTLPFTLGAPGVTILVSIVLGFASIAAILILWFSLLIRKALLLVAVVVAPLALSGSVWEHTKGWMGKWVSFVVALAVSKLIVVVIFLVATAQLTAPVTLDISAIADPVSGVVLMLIAGFAPYMAYKVVSFMGYDMYQAMSTEQEAKQAANRPLPIPTRPRSADSAKGVLDKGGKGAHASESSAPASQSTGSANATGASGKAATSGAGASSGAGATGGSAGASAGTGAGVGAGAAAAGPAAAAIIGAKVAGEVIKAGPAVGNAVGAHAEGHVGASQEPSQPPPRTPAPTVTPDATPKPPQGTPS